MCVEPQAPMPTDMEEQLGDERISAPKIWQRFPAQVSSQRAGAKGAYRCGIAWDCVGWLGELIMRETSSYPLGSVSKPCAPGEHQNSW